jgi:hypothetical protein
VSRPQERRLAVLERAPDARGVDFRVFSTVAEADADARPSGPGMKVIAIVTGVPRSPGTA